MMNVIYCTARQYSRDHRPAASHASSTFICPEMNLELKHCRPQTCNRVVSGVSVVHRCAVPRSISKRANFRVGRMLSSAAQAMLDEEPALIEPNDEEVHQPLRLTPS